MFVWPLAAEEEAQPQEELPANLLDFHLPIESQLLLAGYKKVSFSYRRRVYLNRPQAKPEEELLVTQELKLRALGIMVRKFYLDIDYDDTRPDASQDVIALYYRGDADEILQEVGVGDLKLELPQTEFVVYQKNVFGAKFHLVFDGSKSFTGDPQNNQPLYKLPRRDNFTSSPAADPRFTLSDSAILLKPPPAVYPNVEVTAIASRTKGISVKREFSGKTQEKNIVLHDLDYEQRKYYRCYQDSPALPLHPGSEVVYLDDRDGYNNEQTVRLPGWPYDFDRLSPGNDYYLNYQTGILTLREPLSKNMVLAISYIGKAGPVTLLLKQEDSYSDLELRNRYFLGAYQIDPARFTLWLTDRSGNKLDLKQYPLTIDYEAGLLTFENPNPFSIPQYPLPQDWRFQLVLHFWEALRVYSLQPGIIKGSEVVLLDEKKLTRDQDYLIDYESGLLTFLPTVELTTDSRLTVTYEYLPFGGKTQKNLLGAQVAYSWLADNRLSFTLMQEKSDLLPQTPILGSTPDQTSLIDGALNLAYPGEPLRVSLAGEWALSHYQPNLMQRVFLDSFEAGLLSLELDMNKELWQIASAPVGYSGPRQTYQLHNSSEDHEDDESLGSLELNYELTAPAAWVALNSTIDPEGVDITQKSYVEMWVYGDGSGVRLNLDLGQLSEDTDGDGVLDTEDANHDGQLSPGEDEGFLFNEGGNSRRVGANNGRLDTEDLDRDGYLDVFNENYLELGGNVDWFGWRKVVLFLDQAQEIKSNPNVPVDRRNVKTARVWLQGSTRGRLRLESIRLVGHRWGKGRLDDTSTLSLDGEVSEKFLVDEDEKNSGDFFREKNERSLKLQYDLAPGESGYTRLNYSSHQDLSAYEKLRLQVASAKSVRLFLRLLTTENDYYQWEGSVQSAGFKELSLTLADGDGNQVPDGFIRQGRADLSNISALALGVINDTNADQTGELSVDNLYLGDAPAVRSSAQKLALSLTSQAWSVRGRKVAKAAGFQTIGEAVLKQSEDKYRFAGELSLIKFSPLYTWWQHDVYARLPNPYGALRSRDGGLRYEDEKRLGGQLILLSQPQLLNWEVGSLRHYQPSYGSDRQETSYALHSLWRASKVALKTRYRYKETTEEFAAPSLYEVNRRLHEREGGLEIEYEPLARLRLNPGYAKLSSTETRNKVQPLRNQTRSFFYANYTSPFGIDPRGYWQENFSENFLRYQPQEATLEDNYGLGSHFTISRWLAVNPFYLDLDYRHEERGRFFSADNLLYRDYQTLLRQERLSHHRELKGLSAQLFNYRRQDSYLSNFQWELVEYLDWLSDFGISYERERNEGSVNLITRSDFSSSLDFDVKKMSPELPLYGWNMLPSYQVINKIYLEEKRSLETRQKLEEIFKWQADFHTSTSYEYTESRETSLREAHPPQITLHRGPAQTFFYRWKDAFVLKIPFTQKRFRLTNRLEMNGRYQRAEVRAKNVSNTEEANQDDYSLNFKYYFTNLITLTIGGNWINYKNLTRLGENYLEQKLLTDIEALF